MDWLYHPAQPFVWHPARAFFIAVGWLLGALVRPELVCPPLLPAAIAWGVFALPGYPAWRGRADIRVALLFT